MTTLERIRAEIEQIIPIELPCDKRTPENIRDMALKIIDKYASEECEHDCEHCAYLECPKEPSEDAVKYSKEQKEYCWDCEHAEMCSWYGTIGCEWKKESCEDAVDRQAVLDCFNNKVTLPCDMDTELLRTYLQAVVDAISNLASVQPTMKTDDFLKKENR